MKKVSLWVLIGTVILAVANALQPFVTDPHILSVVTMASAVLHNLLPSSAQTNQDNQS